MSGESDFLPEDIFGIGIDIVEIQRFKNLHALSPFFKRVYTEKELDYCLGFSEPSSHLAAIFAGKEAVTKAIGEKALVSMKSIEILHDENGLPKAMVCQLPEIKILLSLSHSTEHAVAIALLIPHSMTASEIALQALLTKKIAELLEGCE